MELCQSVIAVAFLHHLTFSFSIMIIQYTLPDYPPVHRMIYSMHSNGRTGSNGILQLIIFNLSVHWLLLRLKEPVSLS